MNLVEMFDEYAKEKGFGPRVVHIPEVGFATYHLLDSECYIEDIFVLKEKRMSGAAKEMADIITVIAKEIGIKKLLGSVSVKAKGKDNSMKTLLAYGMSPESTNSEMIFFSKEI